MKTSVLIYTLLLFLISCSNEQENFITIKGRVEREINGQGISNQKVYLVINQSHGSGYWHYTTKIDSKEIITDLNGNFSVLMKNDYNTFVSVFKSQDDNYTSYELSNFDLNNDIVIKVHKFLKFKIYVNNTNPFDANDKLYINFNSGNNQNFRTKIENFGVQNVQYPAENLPGGGSIGAYEEASWTGINVNSIVYYNVPENANIYKVYWSKRKNMVEAMGFTPDIPFQTNQLNEYYFNY